MTRLRSGSATDIGLVRRVNQDQVLEADTLFAVADGMGGHAGGEVASKTAVEALRSAFEQAPDPPSAGDLVGAVEAANEAVWDRAAADPDLRGMGTTLTALALVTEEGKEELALAHVGDSRAYRFRQGRLDQLTADHSLVGEMVRRGQLSAAEAAGHPQRHVVTRAVGIDPMVEVDAWLVRPTAGDRILVCSDGLVDEVEDAEIATVLGDVADPGRAARELVSLAREHGGKDNITVLVVDVVDAPAASAPGQGALDAGAPGEGAPGAGAVVTGAAPGEAADPRAAAGAAPGSGTEPRSRGAQSPSS
ncbi:MAG: Stp1/IreP family PP2C-type Ser/Thr phosphatase, partial [Acidimicrobiales bacterium]